MLERLRELAGAGLRTTAGLLPADRLKAVQVARFVLRTLADAIEPLPPLEFLQAIMADRGLKQKDLVSIFGSQGITSEVLNGKREISKAQARRLSERFRLPIDIFI